MLLPDLQWEGTAALGPILLEGDVGEEELTEPPELLPEPASLLQTHEVTWAGETALVVSTRGSAPMGKKAFKFTFFLPTLMLNSITNGANVVFCSLQPPSCR